MRGKVQWEGIGRAGGLGGPVLRGVRGGLGGPVLLLVEPRIVAGIHRLEHRYIAGVLVWSSARYMCLAVYKSHLLHCLASAHVLRACPVQPDMSIRNTNTGL